MAKPEKRQRGGARKGAGRPHSDASLRNQSKVTVLISNDQRRFLESIAVQTDVTVPGLIRHLLDTMVASAVNCGNHVDFSRPQALSLRSTNSKRS